MKHNLTIASQRHTVRLTISTDDVASHSFMTDNQWVMNEIHNFTSSLVRARLIEMDKQYENQTKS